MTNFKPFIFVFFCSLLLLLGKATAADVAQSVSGPSSVYPQQVFDVTVQYQADANRQVSVYLFNTSNWQLHGSASVQVAAGSGSVTLQVPVNNPPVGTDYQWTGKVEELNGNQLSQTSQWCQVLFAPTTGEVEVTVDLSNPTGRKVNKRVMGLNLFQAFKPSVSGANGSADYKQNLAAMKPSHVRFHSWEMVRPGTSGTWVDSNGNWDFAKVNDVLSNAISFDTEVLINIPWPPEEKGWLNADGTLNVAHYLDFALWCAELVDYVNNTMQLNVRYWELTNERDGVYYGNCAELGKIFNLIAAECKKVDPNILTGGPAFEKPFAEHIQNVRDFMETTKETVDFISYHSYHLSGEFDHQQIFNAGNWGWVTNMMRGEWENISSRKIEFHHNEYNISADMRTIPDRVNEASMVFDAMMMVSLMNAGADVADAWNESDGWFGKLEGNGSFSRRPSSYLFEMLNKEFDQANIVSTNSSNDSKIVTLSGYGNGRMQLLLINRSEAEQQVTVSINGLDGQPVGSQVEVSRCIQSGGLQHTDVDYTTVSTGDGYVSKAYEVTLLTFDIGGGSASDYHFYSESGDEFQQENGFNSQYAMTVSSKSDGAPEGNNYLQLETNAHYANYAFKFPSTVNKSDWNQGHSLSFQLKSTVNYELKVFQGDGQSDKVNLSSYASLSGNWEQVEIPLSDFNIDYAQLKEIQFYNLWQTASPFAFDDLKVVASTNLRQFSVTSAADPADVVLVYPNPATHSLIVNAQGAAAVEVLGIYQASGIAAQNYQLLQEEGQLKVMVGQLPAGLYYLNLRIGNEKISKPFIKQ
ncbi:T9SS type A sorting domain-containing protein [Persicobacter diffluens]|uniref:Glycosyl hydrolases family 39 N-terminal catalytic domain-containing protein n=1 Tax=Persicobacter diffluens TaxID=981 RepID=A0AAN5APK5_9BACT|nr:hypothetical protein PEDI_49730 [Persicobacter diffluens]